MYAQDTSALPKIASRYGVHIRSTHGGYAPFPQGYAAMIKRIATPCKIYGVPHWLEPPSTITPDGEVSRIMEALSCGNFGFWDWGQNPVSAANVFRQYTNYLTQEKPVVDVALFFPTTDHRLHLETDFPRHLQAVGAQLRDVMDFDIVDEELIADNALKHYRVLIWVEGKYVESSTLETIAAWVNKGGVLLWSGNQVPQTVESWERRHPAGVTTTGATLLGLDNSVKWQSGGKLELKHLAFLRHLSVSSTNKAEATTPLIDHRAVLLATAAERPAIWAMPHHKGWCIAAAGLDQPAFYELARDVVYNLSKLDPTKTDAPEVDADWDGVYATLLQGGEVILHNFSSEQRTKTVGGNKIILPPKSLRSAMNKTE